MAAEQRATCHGERHVSPAPSPTGGQATSPQTPPDVPLTPSRKNKRKMSAPKKRTDFSIKRFCEESGDSESDIDEDFSPLKEHPPETPVSTPSGSDQGDSENSREQAPQSARREHVYPLTVPTVYLTHAGLSAPMLAAAAAAQHMLPHPSARLVAPSPSPSVVSASCPSPTDNHSNSNNSSSSNNDNNNSSNNRRLRKNYKNMTRDRRVEANARERTRVHTISAAFESLRRAVPSYSYNQRLSKLAILRIASSYILALSRLADMDYSHDKSEPEFADCVDLCTRTIQAEGKAKRRH